MKNKHQKNLNNQKFERISFSIDYLRQLQLIQDGQLKVEDFAQALSKFYDSAFADGQIDVMERYVASMFGELDELYDI